MCAPMQTREMTSLSKFLSLVLRHEPQHIGLVLDEAGWVDIGELLRKMGAAGKPLRREQLQHIVDSSDKQRFAISEDGLRIRANQGHSVSVDLGLAPVVPPPRLFHGTATRFLEAIVRDGLVRRERHHVHLSARKDTAAAVGERHGQLVLLEVDAAAMQADGHRFFCSANGVWLTDSVPARYLTPCEPDPV